MAADLLDFTAIANLIRAKPVVEFPLGSALLLELQARLLIFENAFDLLPLFATLEKFLACFGEPALCSLCQRLKLLLAPSGGFDVHPFRGPVPRLFGRVFADISKGLFAAVADGLALPHLRAVDAGG
jgi:hypothetical protein